MRYLVKYVVFKSGRVEDLDRYFYLDRIFFLGVFKILVFFGVVLLFES